MKISAEELKKKKAKRNKKRKEKQMAPVNNRAMNNTETENRGKSNPETCFSFGFFTG